MTDTKPTTELNLETVITGAEFRDFYQNHWPKEWYVEDPYVDLEDDMGKFILPDDAKHKLSDFGYAGWQGSNEPTDGRTVKTIGELYIEIIGAQAEEYLIVFKVAPEQAEALKAAAAALGARLI